MNKIIISAEEAKKSSFRELFNQLSSSKSGISSSKAHEKLFVYGKNEIEEKKVNPVINFLKYFWGPMAWLIEIAVILSALIQHWADFGIILSLLFLNAVVGFWQEHKASNAVELLKEKLALDARVLRDGRWQEVPARELVPGDLVYVNPGDIVPADLKIENDISVDESSLTGESLPVDKKSSDLAYSGSIVTQGETCALVIATGMNTYFGKTAQLVEKAPTSSFLQKTVIRIGDFLIILAMILVSIIFIVSLFRFESFFTTLQFALVLVVASIPVALPAVLSVTMAVGAVALTKKEAIVSKLVAIEEMAGVDVLCSDKTGTITKNELTLGEIRPFGKYTTDEVLLYGLLASKKDSNDPIDTAIFSRAREIRDKITEYETTDFKPFNPVIKHTEARIKNPKGKIFKVAKGASQVIFELTKDNPLENAVDKNVDELAKKGYRALGIAKTKNDNRWEYVGLFGFYDPPREDSAETIKTAESMGLDVKMVTGDHISIAKQISKQVNLGHKIIIPEDFVDKPDRTARKVVEETDGFAEVFPEHKYHIVELLQEGGHIVAMTGDGVNDAPALKKANVGIAVAGASDAAKSAASIVFTRPGISVIIDSIKESRKIFQRMNNYAIYRIAETVRVLFFISLSIIFFNFFPITALMIVLLALLNDAPIMTIAYDNVIYSNEPEKWDLKVVLGIATMLGLIGVISSFFMLYIGLDIFKLNLDLLQSFIYLKLSVAGHLTVFLARTKGHFWEVKPALPLFLAVVITQSVATLIVVYGILLPAIGWYLAAFIWIYAIIAFVITDFIKVRLYRFLKGEGIGV